MSRALAFAALLAAALPLSAGLLDSTPAPVAGSGLTPAEHLRGAEQTYLTYPEWFLVHSPAEYAAYVKGHTPTEFPFFGHIHQFWESYAIVSKAANDGYPFNFGYHVMILVIGGSTTVEYALRSAYETIPGRLSDATAGGRLTEEDRYGAKVAQDYVDFIRVLPWYEYDFAGKLAGLWRETPLWGPDAPRKWERKYALTSEYLIKAAYGWLIKAATKASYDEALLVTAVVIDKPPAGAARELPKLEVLKELPEAAVLALVPRYHAFMEYASKLAERGVQFREIAGNRAALLVTAIAPAGWKLEGARELFRQPVPTQPGRERVALVVTVPTLSSSLQSMKKAGVQLEHIYDY